DAERESAFAHAFRFHRVVVVARHQHAERTQYLLERKHFHCGGLRIRQRIGKTDDRALPAAHRAREFDELEQAIGLRAAQVVAPAEALDAAEAALERTRDILHVHGLKTRFGTGQQEDRRETQKRREQVEKAVAASEYH